MAKIFTNNNKLMTIGNSFLCKYEPPPYNITYSQVTGGTFSGPASAHENDTVNVTATADTNYNLDYITVNGSQITGTSFSMPAQDSIVSGAFVKFQLPANTVRVRTSDGNVPIKGSYTSYNTATKVSGTTNVYDIYKSGTNFDDLLSDSTNVVEILGVNTTGIISIQYMFKGCTSLTSIPLFDTSKVNNMTATFAQCSSLTYIPLFDTSIATDMSYMFYNCPNVQSGALALYQQASTQSRPPSSHTSTFTGCGINTVTGAAELAQIPSGWK